MGALGAIVRYLDTLIGPGIMLLYPLYASIRAMESPSRVEEEQWLSYWVIYSFLSLFELSHSKILAWIPIWRHIKMWFCLWLVLPNFNGAAYIYENFVRKYYLKFRGHGHGNSSYPDAQKRIFMRDLDTTKSG